MIRLFEFKSVFENKPLQQADCFDIHLKGREHLSFDCFEVGFGFLLVDRCSVSCNSADYFHSTVFYCITIK